MHELSIVEALIEQVRRELRLAGQSGRVVKLELSVGRLSGVHSDSLRFAFQLLAPGTAVEGAELAISEPPAVCRCRRCNAQVDIQEFTVHCPKCQSGEVVIEGGRDLLLESIELEEAT